MDKTKSDKLIFTCFIQARMNSSRLPNKVLKPILKKTVLETVVERVKKSRYLNKVIVLTSTSKKDDEIFNFCKQNFLECFRGEEDNVLLRFYSASLIYKSDYYIRINADCPFIDWNLIDLAIEIAFKNKIYDYISTILSNSFPTGQHIELFKSLTLHTANKFATNPLEREHVTPYIYNNKDKFKIYPMVSDINESSLRLTIDYPEDLVMCRELMKKSSNDIPSFNEIKNILKRYPEIKLINSSFTKSQFININNQIAN